MKHSSYSILFSSMLLIATTSASVATATTVNDADIATQITSLNASLDQTNEKITDLIASNQALESQLKSQTNQYQTDKHINEERLSELTSRQEKLDSNISHTIRTVSTLTQDTKAADRDIRSQIQTLSANTQQQNEELFQQLSNRTLAILASLIILLGILAATFYLLRKRQQESDITLNDKVQSALEHVKQAEENIVQSDMELSSQLLAVLEQLKLERQALVDPNLLNVNKEKTASNIEEIDHTLALKLADEIYRMRKRLQALPKDTKGIKSLSKSLERLEGELEDQGYELVDYLGSNYTDNMSIQARFVPSDDVGVDESIITKVIYPQVNYNEKMIRMADVEVSVG